MTNTSDILTALSAATFPYRCAIALDDQDGETILLVAALDVESESAVEVTSRLNKIIQRLAGGSLPLLGSTYTPAASRRVERRLSGSTEYTPAALSWARHIDYQVLGADVLEGLAVSSRELHKYATPRQNAWARRMIGKSGARGGAGLLFDAGEIQVTAALKKCTRRAATAWHLPTEELAAHETYCPPPPNGSGYARAA